MNNKALSRSANSAANTVESVVSDFITEIEAHEETIDKLTDEVDLLNSQIEDLKAQIYELQNDKDELK